MIMFALCAFLSAKLSHIEEATAWGNAALWAFIALIKK